MTGKGASPFYPGQPVPVELFTGRDKEIQNLLSAVRQVEAGKPQAVFLTGEYGIGKSSLAGFMRYYAEKANNLFGVHVLLGGASTIEEVAEKTVEAVLKTPAYEPTLTEKARNFLSRYIGKQELFGVSVNLKALKADAPDISRGYLPFLGQMLNKLKEDGVKGLMLVLDEINGIACEPKFAHFIKALVDENALSPTPLPILLMLCGVEERRHEMKKSHQPIERIFDIVEIKPMQESEMREFFIKAFQSQGITVDDNAMPILCRFSAGFPKIMHIVGDETFFANGDDRIDGSDAFAGIFNAAENIGRKFVESQVLKALKSEDYRSIMEKLGILPFDLSFQKSKLEEKLSRTEKPKLNNFLQRLKKLNVLRSGEGKGEYIFNSRMVRLYILLNAMKKGK